MSEVKTWYPDFREEGGFLKKTAIITYSTWYSTVVLCTRNTKYEVLRAAGYPEPGYLDPEFLEVLCC